MNFISVGMWPLYAVPKNTEFKCVFLLKRCRRSARIVKGQSGHQTGKVKVKGKVKLVMQKELVLKVMCKVMVYCSMYRR